MSATGIAIRSISSPTPTLDEVGGEDSIYSERDEVLKDPSLLDVVRLLCRSWPELKRHDDAVSFLLAASDTTEIAEFSSILDVVLTSVDALPSVADGLATRLRQRTRDGDLRAEMAAEAWTRLALGNWCGHLHVQAALLDLADSGHTSPYLIRSLGAALAEWNDSDIEQAMLRLVEDDDIEGDIAMELGAYSLAKAAGASTQAQAVAELEKSTRWFARADDTEDRRDAPAFRLATDRVLAFAVGETISTEDVESLQQAADDYLLIYRNEEPHWRQPRAQSLVEWVSLIESMRRVAELDAPAWFEPAALIGQAAALYSAHQSLSLVVDWSAELGDRAASPTRSATGIAAIIQPRIKAGFAAKAHSFYLVDQWLKARGEAIAVGSDISDEELAFVLAIVGGEANGDEPRPKASSEPTALLAAARATLQNLQAASSTAVAAAVSDMTPLSIPSSTLQFAEEDLVRRIVEDCRAISGPFDERVELGVLALVAAMVRCSAFLIDSPQSGERKVPWLGVSKKPFFPEYKLADWLHIWLCASNLPSQVERSDVAGGRVDIAVQFERFKLFIEVKRELRRRTDAQLFSSFADQAIQYASTNVPIAFLAVLDYSRREVRVDLTNSFWTSAHQTATSREYAVTGFRVQGNNESPSASSRRAKTSTP